jgi:DNA-binding MarR family transcriptional regulator
VPDRIKIEYFRIKSYQACEVIVSFQKKEGQSLKQLKSIYISENAGCKSGEIADKLNIPNPTVKRILSDLVSKELIEKYGKGAGTNYSIK